MPNLLETGALPVNFDTSKGNCYKQPELLKLFFAFGPTKEDMAMRREAKQICAFCPIKKECFDYAVSDWRVCGIWGGTTEDQRKQIRSAENAEKRRLPGSPRKQAS